MTDATLRLAGEQPFHPVADIFPMMSDRELLDLTDDIRENGLREPIWLHRDGRVIDGRNRWLACLQLTIEPHTRTYEGDNSTLVAFVVSLNLHRRHLTESQRAMVAARLSTLKHGQRADRAANLPVSQPAAADLLNVSERSVRDARRVQDSGVPELVAAVDAGEIAVSTAAAIASVDPDEQRDVIAADDEKEIVRRANEIKSRKREQRRQQWEEERRAARAAGSMTLDGPEVRAGDFAAVLADLEDGSVDLILTDPPYGDAALPSYARLAEFAAAKLKPGGSLICYTGQSILPGVLDTFDKHLRYWWTLSLDHSAGGQQLPGKWVFVEWKPIVWYVRGHREGRHYVADKVRGTRPDKDAHEWAQGAAEVEYLIESLTEIGALVVDPFAGSGSFGRTALKLGRRFVGADLDPDSATGTVVA
ncbi:MAG TPA: DNA methyltransferase [Micromonosporaceae bacterium]